MLAGFRSPFAPVQNPVCFRRRDRRAPSERLFSETKSTSAPPTPMRLFPARRPLNRNRAGVELESRDPRRQRARITSISEPERRRAGTRFVWFGKTGEREVEVAGLTPAGDTLPMHLVIDMVPSETGASYGDLDPEYLTASYRVYLNEPDTKRVFAYIGSCRRVHRSGTP